jgi:hypothetical protein
VIQRGEHFISCVDGTYNFILLPKGKIKGPSFVKDWIPVTPKTEIYYNS